MSQYQYQPLKWRDAYAAHVRIEEKIKKLESEGRLPPVPERIRKMYEGIQAKYEQYWAEEAEKA